MSDDPILEVLDDILDNGGKLPARVSNRLLLAASVKGIRLSGENKTLIEETNDNVSKNTTRIWVLVTVTLIIASLLSAHLGGIKIPFILP